MKGIKLIFSVFAASLVFVSVSCNRQPYEPIPDASEVRRVLLYYCDGYSNISSDIYKNIQELYSSLPDGRTERFSKVFVFSHLTAVSGDTRNDYDYVTPCNPVLIDAWKDEFGRTVCDTVKVFPADMVTSSAQAISEVLNYIHDNYPAKEYGMIFSSHGTGWLPKGYYDYGEGGGWDVFSTFSSDSQRPALIPDSSYGHPLEGPKVKTAGAQAYYNGDGKVTTHEIEIRDFAAAIPFHLKYLVFDACLMGGIEVAYEFSGKVDLLAFSQTEVLAAGFKYDAAVGRLLFSEEPDLEGFCSDYFHKFADNGSSATISLVDCNRLDDLAAVCASLYDKYRIKMRYLSPRNIQGYFRGEKHWFYDLRDILVNCGISDTELSFLDSALASCVLYKEATDYFLGVPIYTHCGLSTYLPSDGSSYLDSFYKEYRWNKATSLVK